MQQQITSRENSQIKRYLKLRDHKKQRTKEGVFVVETAKLLDEAIAAKVDIEALFCTTQGYQRVAGRLPSDAQCYLIADSLEPKLTVTANGGGVFAICKQPAQHTDLATLGRGRYLYLCGLQDTGNVGTIIRTALALGLSGLVVSADCCDIYSLKVLRAAMGGVFHLPIYQGSDGVQDLTALSKTMATYAAVVDNTATDVQQIRFEANSMVVIGNEGNGLPSSVVDVCRHAITIRMQGDAESLNAGMAAGILMWEQTKG